MIRKLKTILLIISLVAALNGCSSAEQPLPDQSQTVSGSEQQNSPSIIIFHFLRKAIILQKHLNYTAIWTRWGAVELLTPISA